MQSTTLTIISVCLYFFMVGRVHTLATRYREARYASTEITCRAPEYPQNGTWHLKYGTAIPGDTLAEHTMVIYECNRRHKLNAPNKVLCNSKWDLSNQPMCEPLCPPIYSTATYTVWCVDKIGINITCDEGSEGAKLYYKCADFHETPVGYKKSLICREGQWVNSTPMCQLACGKKLNTNYQTLAYNAEKLTYIEYPWITAVYRKDENDSYLNICGGSLISQTVVLTAAHCVCDEKADVFPPSKFAIGAGKIYNKYQDPRDKYSQYINVFRVVVNGHYKALDSLYSSDIALIVTERPFRLTTRVQPVCFNGTQDITLHPGEFGEIAGWGINEDGVPSDELRKLKMPYKNKENCSRELPSDFDANFNQMDKICAGLFNQSTSICQGDSGSGLVFKNHDDDKYYIHGIASLSVRGDNNKECNSLYNSLYISVGFYIKFIQDELYKYAIRDCFLPRYPVNGKWSITDKSKKQEDIVPSYTSITFTCNKGYHISSSTATVRCDEQIKPTCQLTCPRLQFPPNTVYECQSNGEKINCHEADENTILTYVCPEGFTKSPEAKNSSTCVYGSWGDPVPSCYRIEELISTEATVIKKQVNKVNAMKEEKKDDKKNEEKEVEEVVPTPKICYFDNSTDVVQVESLTSNLCTHVMTNSKLSPEGNLKGNENLTAAELGFFVLVVIILGVLVNSIYRGLVFIKNKFFRKSR